MSSPGYKFRDMCLELLQRDGTQGEYHWSLFKDEIDIYWQGGRLVVNHIPGPLERPTLIWSDTYGGAQTSLSPYYKKLERWLVLERLADV